MEFPFLFELPSYEDNRGIFSPLPIHFSHKHDLRLRKDWIQSNISINPNMGTFRGMHFQDPLPQSKLINVISGEIIDFVIDIREEKSTYGQVDWWMVDRDHALYVPKGFAHGFLTWSNNTVVQYLVDEIWSKNYEDSINPLSVTEINHTISEMMPISNIIISDRDKNAQNLNEYLIKKNHKTDNHKLI